MATNYPYRLNIPLGTNKPSVDQPNMQINTNSINSLISTDHLTFQTATGTGIDGYHTVIHFEDQGAYPSTPVTTPDYGQIYTNTVTPTGGVADQELFYQSGNGIVTQLTSGFSPTPGQNGYTYLPGGLILQWGRITPLVSETTTPVLFATSNINFPNNCFVVLATLINPTSTGNAQTISIRQGSISNEEFSYNYSGGSAYNGFYWIAIGN
jgi:hypothetical protein